MKVADLTVEELELLIRNTVTDALQTLLDTDEYADPDEGLELRPEVVIQLREALKRRRSGERGTPASVVAKELGMDWDEL